MKQKLIAFDKKKWDENRINERKAFSLHSLGGKCAACGSVNGLEFDHKEPHTKFKKISSLFRGKLDILIEELKKCQLLCRDCHILKTAFEARRQISHGTQNGYQWHKCRCEMCTMAHAINNMKYYKVKERKEPEHGTIHMYSYYKCRCDECRRASTDHNRDYRKRIRENKSEAKASSML